MAGLNQTSNPIPPAMAAAATAATSTVARNVLLRRFALLIGLVLVTTSAGYWWLHRTPAPIYRTEVVTRGDVQRTVIASGTVNPMTTVQVGTYVSGVIQELLCDFNTRVKAGQLCARIDPRPYQTIVDQETAALGTARAQLAKDQAALAFARVIYDRDVDLLKRRIVSQETVDTASNARDQAIAQVALDESTIAQRIATLHAANVNLEYTNIISPVDGTVVSRNVTQGQTVAASFQTPTLFLIATDLTQMQVDTNISESDIGSIAVGNKVLFTVEAYPDHNFIGTVEQVRQAPQSVQNVITYDAVVNVANTDLLLKPGMTAAVRVITAERKDVLRVPNLALRFTPAFPQDNSAGTVTDSVGRDTPPDNAVWMLVDSQPDRVPLEVGLSDEAFTEVTGGALAVGDTIIVGIGSPSSAKERAGAWSGSLIPHMPSR
jgi:HlyD family secretion protein